MCALSLKVSAPLSKHTYYITAWHVLSTGRNVRPGLSPREEHIHSFHQHILIELSLLCVRHYFKFSGYMCEKIDKNCCPQGVYSTVTIFFSETSTTSYQQCGMCVFSHSWNGERRFWEAEREEIEYLLHANSGRAVCLPSWDFRNQMERGKKESRRSSGKRSRRSRGCQAFRCCRMKEHHDSITEVGSLSNGGSLQLFAGSLPRASHAGCQERSWECRMRLLPLESCYLILVHIRSWHRSHLPYSEGTEVTTVWTSPKCQQVY